MKTIREKGMALITTLLILVLISSIIVGFSWLAMTDQSMGAATNQRQESFYAAEAGMEQLTANLNNLFAQNYSPSAGQVNALAGAASEPAIPNATFIDPNVGAAGSGYSISFLQDKFGNPLPQSETITAGPYQGMQGLVTPYTLKVVAQSPDGGEVRLQRVVQTVGIPLFQFGIFSQTDLSFFAGPLFNFGGRVHTNGNLYLAEGSGNTLTLGDKVTSVGEVIRTNLSNGWATSSNYTGTVNVLTAPGSYRPLLPSEGSLSGTLGSGANPNWSSISLGTYHAYIRDGDLYPPQYTGINSTGARALNLTIATPQIGGTPIDLIRRPQANELAAASGKLGERYFSQASVRILLSDNPSDIQNLPCETSTPPVDLSVMAQPVTNWPNVAPYSTIKAFASSYGTVLVPLAASGGGAVYSSTDGYWVPINAPIIKGFLKIEAQTTYGVPCGSYKDVTEEILGLGYASRNIDPVTTVAPPTLPARPTAQIPSNICLSAVPNPNAVLFIERVRDNPSTQSLNGGCGVNGTAVPPNADDYWPNVLFDPREGNPRDKCPDGTTSGGCGPGATGDANAQPTFQGLMYYIGLDVGNLAKWFQGSIGVSGPSTKDPNNSPNDFSVYFSDRRGNYIAGPMASGWPPASPTGNETGEYGYNDFVNPNNAYGCPNGIIDTGEQVDSPQDMTLQTYGAIAANAPYPLGPYPVIFPYAVSPYGVNNLFTIMTTYGSFAALKPNWKCATPSYVTTLPAVWPGWYPANGMEARENPALFFRRALKLVGGGTINLGTCPSGVSCGLTIASENPVYIQGNFNAPGGSFVAPYAATAILADSVTLLSNSWNDVNSFTSTYSTAWRRGSTTSYRVAIAAGKGVSFPQPSGTPQDYGTDGGVHNFLRFVETWGGTLNYRGSIVSLYYNRQGTGLYKCCTTVYGPPTRAYNFDTDFLNPTLLPPRTPMFRDTNTIGFTQYLLPN